MDENNELTPQTEGQLNGTDQPLKQDSRLHRFWVEWRSVVYCLAVVFVLFKCILQLAWVPSGSMETTLPTRSLTVGWQLSYLVSDPTPHRGDIVTFWSDELDELLIKRVIGLPGDTITFRAGYVYINGELLDEWYLDGQGITDCDETFTVPEGCFVPMGDNRTGSWDARGWDNPYISVAKIQARTLLTFSFGKSHAWQGVHWMTGR